MKTWMFVAEVWWLFVGMCIDPESTDHVEPADSCTGQSTTQTMNEVLRTWTVSGSIRPPPLGRQSTPMTIW